MMNLNSRSKCLFCEYNRGGSCYWNKWMRTPEVENNYILSCRTAIERMIRVIGASRNNEGSKNE